MTSASLFNCATKVWDKPQAQEGCGHSPNFFSIGVAEGDWFMLYLHYKPMDYLKSHPTENRYSMLDI